MIENHKKFLNHLESSKNGVWLAARWLNDIGYDVAVPPTSKAATHAEWKKHKDDGDLFIKQRVEVKQLSVSFSCLSDWPFGKKFIVCAKHSFDGAVIKPMGYLIFSKDSMCVAVVRSETSERWYVGKKKDSRYNNVEQEFYFAPIDCVQFFPINK